jgi:hypothetical protein
MERFINQLSSSGSQQGLNGNFGFGAKISADRSAAVGLFA